VLDTWFSSGLWPFSTLGWPEDTADLRYFYPTSVLSCGTDILFFWVARMITLGLHFLGERPFEDVLIHGMVRDGEGRKMSKSLGNGIDPLEVVAKYGADATRYATLAGVAPGADTRFSYERAESARNFANKLWNASRFVLMNLPDDMPAPAAGGLCLPDGTGLELADEWILSRLARLTGDIQTLFEGYEVGEVARRIYDFVWNEYCDWYIEMAKIRLYGQDQRAKAVAQTVLLHVLERTLRLLHPVMPFVTEEIWQALPHDGPSIMIAPWPVADRSDLSDRAETSMGTLMEVIRAIRNIRAEMNVPLGKRADVIIHCPEDELRATLVAGSVYMLPLASIAELSITPSGPKPAGSASAILAGLEIYVPLRGLIDIDRETARLHKALVEAGNELARSQARLANPNFVGRAPAEVVAKEQERAAVLADSVARLEQRLQLLGEDLPGTEG